MLLLLLMKMEALIQRTLELPMVLFPWFDYL